VPGGAFVPLMIGLSHLVERVLGHKVKRECMWSIEGL